MRCNSCFSEWKTVGNEIALFCPFCNEPLHDIDRTFSCLEDVLMFLVNAYGKEIYYSRNSVMRFLEFYFPDGKREQNFLEMVYALNIINSLFKSRNATDMIQKSVARQAVMMLCDTNGVAIDWAEYIIGCICKSLDMSNTLDESLIRLEYMANHNEMTAQYKLALKYHSGDGIAKNQLEYINWLNRSASNNYPPALYLLGKELYLGEVCDRNIEGAERLLSKAIELQSADAICFVANTDEFINRGIIHIDNYVHQMIENKEEMMPRHLVLLSKYYKKNNDIAEALSLAELAYRKDKNIAWRCYYYALLLDETQEGKIKALRVLKETATSGNCDACKMLGKEYEKTAKSQGEIINAIYWYRMAAEGGDVETQIHLAEIYEKGLGIEKDIEQAIFWYQIAANNGSEIAKRKVSFKSKDCIVKSITLLLDDDSEIVCNVKSLVSYKGEDYLIITDHQSQESVVFHYIEDNSVEGYTLEPVDEDIEKAVMSI